MNILGSNIKYYREQIDLTQEKLAEMVGVTKSAISDYEGGKYRPSKAILIKISEALSVGKSVLQAPDPEKISYKDKIIVEDPTSKIIGGNIKRYRVDQGISGQKFAELIGKSPSMLSQIENGNKKPTPELLKTITDVLQVNEHDLLFEEWSLENIAQRDQIEAIIEKEMIPYKEMLQKAIDAIANNERGKEVLQEITERFGELLEEVKDKRYLELQNELLIKKLETITGVTQKP